MIVIVETNHSLLIPLPQNITFSNTHTHTGFKRSSVFHPTPETPHMCSSEAPDGAAQSYVSIRSSSPTPCVFSVTLPHLAWTESWPGIQREELLIDSTQNSVRLKCVQASEESPSTLAAAYLQTRLQRSKSVNFVYEAVVLKRAAQRDTLGQATMLHIHSHALSSLPTTCNTNCAANFTTNYSGCSKSPPRAEQISRLALPAPTPGAGCRSTLNFSSTPHLCFYVEPKVEKQL